LYEDSEDDEEEKAKINERIKFLEQMTHRLERKYEIGGTIIGAEPELLQGVVDMHYTDLVGETPAMSSGELFAAGGSIDTSRTFYEADYERLIKDVSNDYPFYSVKNGSYWKIKKSFNDQPVAKWYPEKNILKITKDEDLLNWLKENNYLSSDEGDSFAKGGKVTFKEKSDAIAKKFVGKKVEPKYQKEYGKEYSKDEAKEVGDKIAGSIVSKEKRKPTANNTKMQKATAYAKANRKEGQTWSQAMKEAFTKVD
jgi:hypothetical protein